VESVEGALSEDSDYREEAVAGVTKMVVAVVWLAQAQAVEWARVAATSRRS
jgi:hypothetical protein